MILSFFLEQAGGLHIFVLRGKRGVVPNYRVQLLSLDHREDCRNMLELLHKRKTLGPDHIALITLVLPTFPGPRQQGP